jgi:hypothetical protein
VISTYFLPAAGYFRTYTKMSIGIPLSGEAWLEQLYIEGTDLWSCWIAFAGGRYLGGVAYYQARDEAHCVKLLQAQTAPKLFSHFNEGFVQHKRSYRQKVSSEVETVELVASLFQSLEKAPAKTVIAKLTCRFREAYQSNELEEALRNADQ